MSEMVPEWAANSRTIHAWRPWVKRDGRRWGHKALCGVTTTFDFGWSMAVTEPSALEWCKSFTGRPVCDVCVERVEVDHG